jgi:A/G-specific adenine glycosylase
MSSSLETAITQWYAASQRDLPWRQPGAGAWPVMVSEFMLQQTPVSRVLPAYEAWLARWPTPPALAAATAGDAVRQWGRLGYPRRALRLHAAAVVITDQHGGTVPGSLAELRSLPGVGSYTAAAVASFAFGQRQPVLDTNVRRVLARLVGGRDGPIGAAVSVAEQALAESLLPPAGGRRAATWSVAVMELGAVVCKAARPLCGQCPVQARCAWRLAGSPARGDSRRSQRYEGSDRQARGVVLAALRTAAAPLPAAALGRLWPDASQQARALAALRADGLIQEYPGDRIGLPGDEV